MKWLATIKDLFQPAPSKQEQQNESMRALQVRYDLSNQIDRLKKETENIPRQAFRSTPPV